MIGKDIINVRMLKAQMESGELEGKQLEEAEYFLNQIKHADKIYYWNKLSKDELELQDTKIVITEDGFIDIYAGLKTKHDPMKFYKKVAEYNPHISLGTTFGVSYGLMNPGRNRDYKVFGTMLSMLNKQLNHLGFYFNTKQNKDILKQAKESYEITLNDFKTKHELLGDDLDFKWLVFDEYGNYVETATYNVSQDDEGQSYFDKYYYNAARGLSKSKQDDFNKSLMERGLFAHRAPAFSDKTRSGWYFKSLKEMIVYFGWKFDKNGKIIDHISPNY